MKLNHIKDEVCPHCNSRVIRETQRNQHCNGQWFETREFKCGMILEHIPNFSETRPATECPQEPKHKQKTALRELAKTKTQAYILALDVDSVFKDNMLNSLKYLGTN